MDALKVDLHGERSIASPLVDSRNPTEEGIPCLHPTSGPREEERIPWPPIEIARGDTAQYLRDNTRWMGP